MKKPNLNFIKNKTAVGVICVAAAILIGFVLSPLVSRAAGGTVTVVRAKAQIPKGSQITASMLETVKMGKQNLPQDIKNDIPLVVGRYAAVDITQGDIITDRKTEKENSMFSLKDGELLISVTLNSFADSLSGKLESGDLVSVYIPDNSTQLIDAANNSAGTVANAVNPPELEYVEVAAVTASSGKDTSMEKVQKSDSDKSNSDYLPATATLRVNSSQAKILAGLEKSTVHLALVCRENSKRVKELLKQQEDYFKSPAANTKDSTSTTASNQQSSKAGDGSQQNPAANSYSSASTSGVEVVLQ